MNTCTLQDLKPGMSVVFVDQSLNTHPICWVDAPYVDNAALLGKVAMVVAVEPTKPGKIVALCLKEKIPLGHSCDGRVPEGHGTYALPEHLYTVAAWEEHQKAAVAALEEQNAINDLLKGFVSP